MQPTALLRTGVLLVATLAAVQCAQQKPAGTAGAPALQTDDDKMLYTAGVVVASNTLGSWKGEFSEQEVDLIVAGFRDGVLGNESRVDVDQFGPKLSAYMQQRTRKKWEREAAENKAAEKDFLDKAATAEGAVRTASGLVYQETVLGTGDQPSATDTVRVHYRGSLVDGTVFDSSIDRGQPIVRQVSGFIPGWQEALTMMRVGGKAHLVVPPDLAYGDRQVGIIPPGSTLVFDLELLGIQ